MIHNMKGALSISRPSARQMPWLNKQIAWLRLRHKELKQCFKKVELGCVEMSSGSRKPGCRGSGPESKNGCDSIQRNDKVIPRRPFCKATKWNRMIQYVISLSSFLVPPTLIAHAAGLKIYKISFDPSNLHGRAQKETVFYVFFALLFCSTL